LDKIKNIFLDLGEQLIFLLKRFWNEASNMCKICTIAALILLIIFIGFDVYEKNLNMQTQKQIEQTADKVFDSPIEQIDKMDSIDQVIFQSTRDLLVELKAQWIKLTAFVAGVIISFYISYLKKPFEVVKDLIINILEDTTSEPWTWIPFGLIGIIDLIELAKNVI